MADRPRRHKKDPAARAADIADREAEEACKEGGGHDYLFKWLEVFDTVLKEFGWLETTIE
jgi:hypothetical protein